MKDRLLSYIVRQIKLAEPELREYPPVEIDWIGRATQTAQLLVPWLNQNSRELKAYVEHVMNSPNDVRSTAQAILSEIEELKTDKKSKKLAKFARQLNLSLQFESLLISHAGGTVVSKLIERFLIERSADWKLESNGASDYPDLFFRSFDYEGLPSFKRAKNLVYGAAVKGKQKRPVRVPDGLEIKTCKGGFAVDCHHAHAGLHLVLLYAKVRSQFVVNDIQIGFLRHELYRITKPASPTTTLKASFNGEHFISILEPSSV